MPMPSVERYLENLGETMTEILPFSGRMPVYSTTLLQRIIPLAKP